MQKKALSVLYLLPIPIAEDDFNWSIPINVQREITNIHNFIVENAKTSRHFLKALNPNIDWSQLRLIELDKHQGYEQNEEILDILKSGVKVGLMSESGMPCIADPGNVIVRLAHQLGCLVKPMVGPSSILLALIASGMNGQCFKFNGYLPSKPDERKKALKNLEKESKDCTQLFIEAPYRNDKMFEDMLEVLQASSRILIAKSINGPDELIVSRSVAELKTQKIEIGKVPCLFGIGR